MREKLASVMMVSLMSLAGQSYAAAIGSADDFETHFRNGVELFEKGNYSDAYHEMTVATKTIGNDKFAEHETEYYKAVSSSYMNDNTAPLEQYLERYSASIYSDKVKYRLAGMLFERGRHDEAAQLYRQVRVSHLDVNMDEYYFNIGYCSFMEGDYDTARAYFDNVDTAGEYGPSISYYFGYMDYMNKNYPSAKKYFGSLAQDASYGEVVLFYLLQIEFLEGNYDYVVNNYAQVMRVAVGERLAEVVRMVSEAWFAKEAWENVCDFMTRYVSMGGIMAREENYMAGYAHYMLDEYAEAERYLSKACGPDDALSQNASYHLGDCYLKLGDTERAMQSFSIASTSGFDDTIKEDALFNYGKMQYASGGGYFDEAINVLNRYLTLYPSSLRKAEAEEYLIAAYYNSKNYNAAYDAIKRYPDPDNNMKSALQKIAYFRGLEAFNDGDYSAAQNYLNESAQYKYSAKYTALATFWIGETYYRQGDYKSASAKYEEYVRNSPASEVEHTYAYYNAAYAYYNDNNLSKAQNWFDRFIEQHTDNDRFRADAYNRMGDIAAAGRSFWKAIEYYDGALNSSVNEGYYAAYRRAVMLGLVDRVPRKIESLNEIISQGRGDYVDDAMYELGRTYMVQEQFSQAATTLEKYVTRYPSSKQYLTALSNLGLIYRNLNDNTRALKYYGMIVDRAYSTAESKNALNEIRNIYVDENKVDEYFKYARSKGLETDMGVMQRDSLEFAAAQRLFMNGDRTQAAEAFGKYITNYPKGAYVAQSYYYGSECAISSGDRNGAVDLLTRLSDLSYNDFTERGLERLIDLTSELHDYQNAAEASKKLSVVSRNTATRQRALAKYVEMSVAMGDNERIIAAADEVLGHADVDATVERKALYAKARALSAKDNNTAAQEIYERLGKDVTSEEGAEATYRMIENAYTTGDSKRAEELIYDFADKNSPHTYWLGKAFITLGDIYSDMGDAFQARATYQSIVDGYSNADDGITAEAQERIRNLK